MTMLCPRVHFYEINDQPWFPSYLREMVQAGLSLMWTLDLPLIQPSCPAALVAKTLQQVLGDRIGDYTYVDFCAGAGGPTPYIEQDLNRRLGFSKPSEAVKDQANGNGDSKHGGVDFVLTDIAPHLEAWAALAKKSEHLYYIAKPVDAANAPRDLLKPLPGHGYAGTRVFRLFSLAFHHFDDDLASQILRNSIETSAGLAIFELQARTLSSLLTVTLMWPLLLIISPFYFWRSPGHLFFTYIIPIVPFVLVFDGWISCLRARTPPEILDLLDADARKSPSWQWLSGGECHTYPIGEMTWFIGCKTP